MHGSVSEGGGREVSSGLLLGVGIGIGLGEKIVDHLGTTTRYLRNRECTSRGPDDALLIQSLVGPSTVT